MHRRRDAPGRARRAPRRPLPRWPPGRRGSSSRPAWPACACAWRAERPGSAVMKRVGPGGLAGGDLRPGCVRWPRSCRWPVRSASRVAGVLGPVAVLDQQPVGAAGLPASLRVAVVRHAHQHPAAAHPLALDGELEVALGQALGSTVMPSGAHQPRSHSITVPPPYSPFGMVPLEVAVVQRVRLHLHRQPLVGGVEGGAARHRPRQHHALVLKAEVVVQAGGVVLLNHEAQALGGGRERPVAERLGRLLRVALGAVGGELSRPWPDSSAAAPAGSAPAFDVSAGGQVGRRSVAWRARGACTGSPVHSQCQGSNG